MAAAADGFPRLPLEIIDMIVDQLQFCFSRGPDKSPSCLNSSTADLLPLRLVCRSFNERLLPMLFDSLKLGPGHDPVEQSSKPSPSLKTTGEPIFSDVKHTLNPATRLHSLLHSPTPGRTPSSTTNLAAYIHSLHLTIYPTLHRTHITTPDVYFKQLRHTLPTLLGPLQALRTLHLDANYAGLAPEDANTPHSQHRSPPTTNPIQPSQPGGSPIFVCRPQLRASLLLHECFTALIDGVRDARLASLEHLQVGVPYEGGYGNFFEREGRARVIHGGLSAGAPRLQCASVKLFNELGDWTIMHVF